jgi:hypothetical protein
MTSVSDLEALAGWDEVQPDALARPVSHCLAG